MNPKAALRHRLTGSLHSKFFVPAPTLKQCLTVLAGPASGHLFEREDYVWGMKMAMSPHPESVWSPRQKWGVWEICLRHEKKLMLYGVDIKTMTPPARPDEVAQVSTEVIQAVQRASGRRRVRLIKPGVYGVDFPPETLVVQAMQKVPNRNRDWSKTDKCWIVKFNLQLPEGEAIAIFNKFLSDWSFVYGEDVRADLMILLGQAVRQEKERDAAFAKSFETDAKLEIPGLNPAMKLRGFQKAGIVYAIEKKRCFIADEQGCISGDALVTINRAGNGKTKTLAKWFDLWVNRKHGCATWKTKAMHDDGIIRLSEIKNIIDSGLRQTLAIKLENGRSLTCTADHEIAVPGGWVAAEKLSPGSIVLTNGTPTCRRCKTDQNLITYKAAKFIGYCKQCAYRYLRSHKHDDRNGKYADKDGYVRVSRQWDHPRADANGTVAEHILVMEKALGRPIPPHEEVHHINGIKGDNRPGNLMVMDGIDHAKLHADVLRMSGSTGRGEVWFTPKQTRVLSIESCGLRRTFDISMESVHNFVANGVIVHNCGKSAQAIGVIEHEKAYPALIICKAALRQNWIKELRMWLTERKCTLDPGDMEYRVMEVLVVSYEGLVNWYDKLEEYDWKSIIVDEGQCIRNIKPKRTKACRDIAKVSKAPVRLILTGTPIETSHYDLVPQLHFLDQMNAMGGGQHFYDHFCDGRTDGAVRGNELNALLRRTCYIRRLKKDVLTELPQKQRAIVPLEIDNMAEYRRAEKDIIAYLRGEVERDPDSFEHDPDEMFVDTSVAAKQAFVAQKAAAAEHLVRITKLKRLAAQGMLEGAKQWIENFVESGEKLVVFALHKETQEQVYRLFKDIAVWTMSGAGAQAAVDRFQNDPKIKIIVCSIHADNAGHTLTAASNVCTIERWWTSTRHDQCEDRAHRIGQRDSVTCWYLQAQGTVYEKIDQLLDQRRAMVEAATDGTKTNIATKSIMGDLVRLLTAA